MVMPIGGRLAAVGAGSYQVVCYATVVEPKEGDVIWPANLANGKGTLRSRMGLTAIDVVKYPTWDGLLEQGANSDRFREEKGHEVAEVDDSPCS